MTTPRCYVTGNPCGTDTVMRGMECPSTDGRCRNKAPAETPPKSGTSDVGALLAVIQRWEMAWTLWTGFVGMGVDTALQRAKTKAESDSGGDFVRVPREVMDFFNFADAAFVPFTSQQQELQKSLMKARDAVSAMRLSETPERDSPDTAWVVEYEAEGQIHYFKGSILFGTTDPNEAVRFSRKEDARRISSALMAGEMSASAFIKANHPEEMRRLRNKKWSRCRVSEHAWPEPHTRESPDEYMCPNCVTPWKCNGPHIPEPHGDACRRDGPMKTAPIIAVCLRCRAAWVHHPRERCGKCFIGTVVQLPEPLPNDAEHCERHMLRQQFMPRANPPPQQSRKDSRNG